MPMPCLDCGRLTRVSRCRACEARHRRQGGYDAAWARMSRQARADQPWCSACGSTRDLTLDHVVPLVRGGTSSPGNVRVMCRSCNSAKKQRYA